MSIRFSLTFPEVFSWVASLKKQVLLAALAALTLPGLAACSALDGEESVVYNAPVVTRMPVDPSDGVLQNKIQQYLADRQGPLNSQYQYTRADLNGDGLREAVVIFNLPHSYWCGWSGCTMAIFQAGDNQFALLNETSRIRGPIVIGDTTTNNWKDIGVRLTGTSNADRNVVLQFDGNTYPDNPLNVGDAPYDLAALGGARVLP